MSEQTRSTNSQKYTMRKRAEQVEQTRLQITEAAVRLHTTLGPAHTTISAVAEEADVTRVTVYRHFRDEEALFEACSAHWARLHPAPDPSAWPEIEGLEMRGRHGLTELYGFFRRNHRDLYPIHRDVEAMPEPVRRRMAEQAAAMGAALIAGSRARGRRRHRQTAVSRHLVSFATWWSLAIDGELDDDQIVDLGVTLLLAA